MVGNAQVSLTWTAPSSDGGAAITDYVMQYSSNGGTNWTTFNDGTSTNTSATITGLTNGTAYVFKVAATNSVGTGNYSGNSNSVTPSGPEYCEPHGGPGWSSVPLRPEALFDGNVNTFSNACDYSGQFAGGCNFDMTYTFAQGGLSVSPSVSVYVGLGVAPSQIGNATNIIRVNNTDITQKVKDAGLYGTPGWLEVTSEVGSVFNSITLKAIDGVSNPAISAISVAGAIVRNCSASAPGAPTSVAGTAGNAQVSLTWTAPSSDGGAAITDYVIQYSSNGGTDWTTFNDGTSTSVSAVVTGLTNGTTYLFKVAALNSVGTGSYSSNSSSLIPSAAGTGYLADGPEWGPFQGYVLCPAGTYDGVTYYVNSDGPPRVLFRESGYWYLSYTGNYPSPGTSGFGGPPDAYVQNNSATPPLSGWGGYYGGGVLVAGASGSGYGGTCGVVP
jgi:titin